VEFFVVGPAVVNARRAFKVTEAAKKETNKQIAVSTEVHRLIADFFTFEEYKNVKDEQPDDSNEEKFGLLREDSGVNPKLEKVIKFFYV
jgi:hypothetical protein